MNAEAVNSALRRKASASKPAASRPGMDTAKAMRFALARAGDKALGVPVSLREFDAGSLLPDDLPDNLPEFPLLLLLEDEYGSAGLCVACPQTVGAIIEASTIGSVLPGEAAERKPTRTDGILAAAFLDRFLDQFARLAAECPDAPSVEGFVSRGALPDARAAQMVLADAPHRRLTARVDFGLGAKVGQLMLILPASRRGTPMAEKEAKAWAESLQKAVMGTKAQLEAVLCTLRLPLAEIAALKPGDLLPLKGVGLDDVRMVGCGGTEVARARLGRAGPVRAVRLCPDEDSGAGGGMAPTLEALAPGAAPNPAALMARRVPKGPAEEPPIELSAQPAPIPADDPLAGSPGMASPGADMDMTPMPMAGGED